MGGSLSLCQEIDYVHTSDKDIMKYMLPVYYTTESLTATDIDIVHASWNMILNDTAPEYVKLKESGDEAQANCVAWFYTVFYQRLFDVHPGCRQLFTREMMTQGSFLVRMISLTLQEMHDMESFRDMMRSLAEKHCAYGVKGIEYGIAGDVLLYSLQTVLGYDVFTPPVHFAWRKVYSAMLNHIIPVCITHERQALQRKTDIPRLQTMMTDVSQALEACATSSNVVHPASTSNSSGCPLHRNI